MNCVDYRERRMHGSFDFPLAFYPVSLIHPRYNMVDHWHNEYEIIRVLSGQLSLVLDGERHLAKAGDIYFVSGGMLHGGTPVDCVYECLVFDLNAILEGNQICKSMVASIVSHEKRIQRYFPPSDENIQLSVMRLMDCMKTRQEGYQFMALGAMYSFLGRVMQNHSYEQAYTPASGAMRRLIQLKSVLSLIKSGYNEELTLDELAACANMNKKYFCRFFKEMTQRSPIDYLNYYRIEIASEQLATTDKNVTEIALNCGFNDVSYFIKVFKKYKSMTPMNYVKRSIR